MNAADSSAGSNQRAIKGKSTIGFRKIPASTRWLYFERWSYPKLSNIADAVSIEDKTHGIVAAMVYSMRNEQMPCAFAAGEKANPGVNEPLDDAKWRFRVAKSFHSRCHAK